MDELTLEGVGRPRCPKPGHDKRRVVRDGYRGKEPSRRQRFRCVNPADRSEWHRFVLPVHRVVAHEHRCEGCAQLVPTHAGAIVPEGYHYQAGVVAQALVDVARGATFQQASARARAALALTGGVRGGEYSNHGSLAADFTEVFTSVVAPPGPWPAVLLADSTSFWRRRGGAKVPAFTVLAAYGYELAPLPPEEDRDPFETAKPPVRGGKLVRLRRSDSYGLADWVDFFASGEGVPQVVVADGASKIREAALKVWPDVLVVRCTWHWTKNLRDATTSDLVRVTGSREAKATAVKDHPLLAEAESALGSPEKLAAFAEHARQLLAGQAVFAQGPSLVLKWLAAHEVAAQAQLAAANDRPGPASTGPLEQLLSQGLRPTLKRRAQGLVNPQRTQLLLDLLVAGYRNEAHAGAWTAALRDHLADNTRRPEQQQRTLTQHRPKPITSPAAPVSLA